MCLVFVLTVLVALCGTLWASEDARVAHSTKVGKGINYDGFYGFVEEMSTGNLDFQVRSGRQTNEKERQGIFPFSEFDIGHIFNVFPEDGKKFELPDFIKNILNLPKQVLKKICQFVHAIENMDNPEEFRGSEYGGGPCGPRSSGWTRWYRDDYPIKNHYGRYPDFYPPPGIRRPEDQDYPYPGWHQGLYPFGKYPSRYPHRRYPSEDEHSHRKYPAGESDDDPDGGYDSPSHRYPLDRFPDGPKKKHHSEKPEDKHGEDKHDKEEKKQDSHKEEKKQDSRKE